MRRWRYIIPAGAVIVLLGMMATRPSGSLALWRTASDRTDEHLERERPDGTLTDGAAAGPRLTKRSERDMGRKPTLEETQDLLRTTIISKIDIEKATLEETVAELNRLARSHGIPERELTFLIAPRLSNRLRSSPAPTIEELRIRNAPLVVLVKYVCDVRFRCRVDPGRVMFGSHYDFDEEPVPEVKEEIGPNDDPFAEPGRKVGAEKMPEDPDDPFSE